MFSVVTFFVFLFRVLHDSRGQELGDVEVTNETLARQWLDVYNWNKGKVYSEYVEAVWNSHINLTAETNSLVNAAEERDSDFNMEACKNASRFNWKDLTDTILTRQFEYISSHCANSTSLTEGEEEELRVAMGTMPEIFSTAKVCKEDSGNSSGNKICFDVEGLEKLMSTSRNWGELVWAWEEWRNVSGKNMRSSYIKMVSLLNKQVKLKDSQDFGDVWRKAYSMENFTSVCEDLWRQVKPLYQQLHAYVRRKLMGTYSNNSRDFPCNRQIPAHILGDLLAQQWDNIFELVKPFPMASVIDVTKLLTDKGFNVLQMVREANSFFISLGLPAMRQEFWNRSLFEKPKDERNVVCHPAAFDFYNKRDFRIKMCAEVNEYFFETTHHEMGHIQYCMSYKDQPFLFQDGANPGFHEAIGDVISLSVMTPQHLHKINLLKHIPTSYASKINFLMKMALKKVPVLPYAYLIDLWRWEVFNGRNTPENYTKTYWERRCGLQGISPPVPRSEEDFDPGTLFHVAFNIEYMRYFVSDIIQFQFHKSLCEAAGHEGPLHKCDIYNSTAAGDKLRQMMSLGSSKPWQDAMEIVTGQRNMDAGPLLEYFRPLQDWLKMENDGVALGWDEECPCGLIQ